MSRLDEGGRWLRSEGLRLAELAGLCAVAVTQPVLGPLGESPSTFVALGASGWQVVVFGLLVALGPLVVVGVVGVVSGLAGGRVRGWVHFGLLGGLGALAAVSVVRGLGAGVGLRVLFGVGVGVGLVVAYRWWVPVRTFLRFASVAPVVLLGVFVFGSPVSSLVGGGSGAVSGPGDGGDDGGGHPPVVMVVFDELPTLSLMDGEGGVDAELFPNLARVADTSTWYRDATTISPNTRVAVPALLTGVLPERDHGWEPGPDEHGDNVFSLLAETHDLHVREWTTSVCPDRVCGDRPSSPELSGEAAALVAGTPSGATAPLTTLLDEAGELWWTSVWPFAEQRGVAHIVLGIDDAHDLVRPGLEFLSTMSEPDDGRPTFDYFHAPVPHQPWYLLPSGHHYDGPYPPWGADLVPWTEEFPAWDDGDDGALWAEVGRARHLLQLQWTDRLLGAIIDRLEDRWDDAVVVVTADHGVSFTPGEELRTLTPGNQSELAWVPLFVKGPGQRTSEVVDDNVLLVDVLPTIAELIGIELGWEVDGRSLLDGPVRERGDKPMVLVDADAFDQDGPGDRIQLDADGLATIREGPGVDDAGDELRVWRIGRHGHLVGQQVTDLGVCAQRSRADATLDVGDGWPAGNDDGALEVWLEALIDDVGRRDVAVSVEGTIVGWAPTREVPRGTEVGVLLAEPLIAEATTPPRLYEIVDGDDCVLAELG